MKYTSLILIAVAGLVLPSVSDAAPNTLFAASVSGTRKYQKTVGANMVIASDAVSNTSLCVAFGVDPKKYAVVFDTDTTFLELIPKSASSGLPTKHILLANSGIEVYNSTSPLGFLSYYSLASGAEAAGTSFDTLQGVMTMLTRQKVVAGVTQASGAVGTVSGVATGAGASPQHYLYQLSISASHPFVQTP